MVFRRDVGVAHRGSACESRRLAGALLTEAATPRSALPGQSRRDRLARPEAAHAVGCLIPGRMRAEARGLSSRRSAAGLIQGGSKLNMQSGVRESSHNVHFNTCLLCRLAGSQSEIALPLRSQSELAPVRAPDAHVQGALASLNGMAFRFPMDGGCRSAGRFNAGVQRAPFPRHAPVTALGLCRKIGALEGTWARKSFG
jgi:hypothetical protein